MGPFTFFPILFTIAGLLTFAYLTTEAGWEQRQQDRADRLAMRREEAKRAALRSPRSIP